MSSVDERIVKMQFDNSGFEAGATKAISILDRLGESLKFKNGTSGLESIQRYSNRFNMDGVSYGILSASNKFSAFQEFVTGVFRRLGEAATDFGVGLFKKVSFGPMMAGFSEYELQMRSIQTISANTGLAGEKGIAKINAVLDDLNEYADKTIYNFSEMTRNIGTFTAAGVDLETSASSIKGIANLAAVSGANSQKASMAMYQLSQAIASGTVKLQDWNSVVSAGMGGAVFQKALIRTARAHGIAVDSMIEKNGTFRESLHEGWLTTEVLTDTLSQLCISYDEVGDAAYNSAMQKLLDANYSKEDAEEILELAKTAEEAATMVRTWTQLWETVGEALGSGWAATFRIIIGDFNQATEVFTYLSDYLGDIIKKSSDARNSVLSVWASDDTGGREALFGSLVNMITAISKPLSAISDSFGAVFGITGEELATITEDFANFSEKLVITDGQADSLAKSFDYIFALLSDGFTIASMVAGGFLDIIENIADGILPTIKKIGNFAKTIKLSQEDIEKLSGDFDTLFSVLSGATSIISKIAEYFLDLSIAVGEAFRKTDAFHRIVTIVRNVSYGLYKILRPIGRAFMEAFGIDETSFDGLVDFINGLLENLEKLTSKFNISDQTAKKIHDTFASLFDIVKKLCGPVSDLKDAFSNLFSGFLENNGSDKKNPFEKISEWFSSLDKGSILRKIGVGAVGAGIFSFIKKLFEVLNQFRSAGTLDFFGINDMLDSVRDSLEQYQSKLKVSNLIKIGVAIALLAGSLYVLSSVDSEKLASSLFTVLTAMLAMVGMLKQIGGMKFDVKNIVSSSTAMISMAIAIGMLSLSLKLLSTIDPNALASSLLALMTIMISMVGALNRMPDSGKLISSSVAMISMGVAIGMLSLSLKLLSTIDADSLAVSMLALVSMMISMVAALNGMPDSGKLISASAAMISMGIAIGMLSLSLKLLSTIDADSLATSMLALVSIMISMVAALNGMPDSGKLISSSVAMISMGAAIGMISLSLKLLSTINPDALASSLLALITIMVVVVGSINALDTSKISMLSAAIVAVGVSIHSLSESLQILSGIKPEKLANSLLALMTVFVVLIGAMTLLSGISAPAIGVGIALITLSVAVGLLALSLKTLSEVDPAGMAVALLAFITTMLVVVGAMALMSGMAAPALAFAAVMLAISVAALLMANAIKTLAIAFSIFTEALPAFVATVSVVLEGIAGAISSAVDKAVELGSAFLDSVKSFFGISGGSSSEMLAVGANIVQGLLDGIGGLLGNLGGKALEIGSAVLNGVGDIAGGLKDKAVNGMTAFTNGVGSFIGSATSKGSEIVGGVINGAKDLAGKMKTKATDGMNSFVTGMSSKISTVKSTATKIANSVVDGFKNLASRLKSTVSNAMDGVRSAISGAAGKISGAVSSIKNKIIDGFSGLYGTFKSIGENIGSGLKVGMDGITGAVTEKARAMGRAAANAAKQGAEVASPSKLTIETGQFIGEGLIVGMINRMSKVVETGKKLGKTAIEGCNEAVSGMALSIQDVMDTDYEPVITPVINPAQFNSDLSSLNRAMNMNMNRIVLDGMNYNAELNAKMVDYADSNNRALQAIADGVIDYNLLGTAVATALINSGIHVEMDGGQLMGYLAGEIRDVRRMYG